MRDGWLSGRGQGWNLPPSDACLDDRGSKYYVQRAGEAALAREITAAHTDDTRQPDPERLPRLGYAYERGGMGAYRDVLSDRTSPAAEEARDCFCQAFTCWLALDSLPDEIFVTPTRGVVSPVGLNVVAAELAGEPLSSDCALAFHLAVTGLAAKRTTETRLHLRRYQFDALGSPDGQLNQVAECVFTSFVLLVRKAGGWQDIDEALASIAGLLETSMGHRECLSAQQSEMTDGALDAAHVDGLRDLAKCVQVTGEYLRDRAGDIGHITRDLDRYHSRAVVALSSADCPAILHLANLLWVGCRELAKNAIWTHVRGLGQQIRTFVDILASRDRANPVLELWPSQQQALRQGLLDPYCRAALIEMPTSAGKTLLAKLAIVQAKALNAEGTIAYIVPTRALVNQMTAELRTDFQAIGMRVEQTVPVYEMDPTEEQLLTGKLDVLVTTPEKLDLLVRSEHPATRGLVLVVADEAHNLREPERGPRLELLLGTIKRDRPDARFLLLSPFLPNGDEIVRWLGEDRALPPIAAEWKPSRKIVGSLDIEGTHSQRTLVLETLPVAGAADIRPSVRIPMGSARGAQRSTAGLTEAAVRALESRGSVLVLCRGKGTAIGRAVSIAKGRPVLPADERREAVCRHIETEAGTPTQLVRCIHRGVAYHHAGMSQETRWLVESLIRENRVQVVCGTTTLAQGVNFPISAVIVETLYKGKAALTHEDFWNIAGRAGRTLIDTVGVIAFPTDSEARRRACIEFLRHDATDIASQLTGLAEREGEGAGHFDLVTLHRWPALSPLLQFLAHAVRVSPGIDMTNGVEDLLRASLVYAQVRRADEPAAQRLVALCRAYLDQIAGERDTLALGDRTGLATPTVLHLVREKREKSELSLPSNWRPERLFGDDPSPLTERVTAIAELPELRLGEAERAPFRPDRVAGILRDWVRGDTLAALTGRYAASEASTFEDRIADFSSYLFSGLLSRASWGIGALQSICADGKETAWDEGRYVPSMLYFGVRHKEAVWLRMVGMPRIVANGLGDLWERQGQKDPASFEQIRGWIDELSDDDWRQSLPMNSRLTPQDMRGIWREVSSRDVETCSTGQSLPLNQ